MADERPLIVTYANYRVFFTIFTGFSLFAISPTISVCLGCFDLMRFDGVVPIKMTVNDILARAHLQEGLKISINLSSW